MELTARAYARCAHTMDSDTGAMQIDLPSALLLLTSSYLSAFGPNFEAAAEGFVQMRANVRALIEAVDNPDTLEESLDSLRISPSAREAGVTAAYNKRMAAVVEEIVQSALSTEDFPEVSRELALALSSWEQSLAAMRRLQIDPANPQLPPMDGRMLTAWFESVSLEVFADQGTPAAALRQAIGRMCAAYLNEEFSSHDTIVASGEADDWFELALSVLAEANTPEDEFIAAILTCLAPARPADEIEWGVFDAHCALALSVFLVLAAGWDEEDDVEDLDSIDGPEASNSDIAFEQFDASMAAWFTALMTCRELFAARGVNNDSA